MKARPHSPPRLIHDGSGWTINAATGLYLDRTNVGWGLFAGRNFDKDERVLTFTGTILTLKETLALGHWSFYSVQIGTDKYVDSEPPGAFINHSCSPNCGIRGSVDLVALSPITRGTELVMDYSTTIAGDTETMTCLCGSRECRGLIGDFFSLPEAIQAKYLSLGSVSDFIARTVKTGQAAEVDAASGAGLAEWPASGRASSGMKAPAPQAGNAPLIP